MEVRLLKPEEHFEANLISTVAFHMKMEDPEKNREESLKSQDEDWGAFSEDGKVMARIINNHYETRLDGQRVRNGGIGAVSTLPEYRNTGAVKAIFEKLIPEAYRNGEIISALYPFNHAFYRKFGYETVRWQDHYEFVPAVLSGYRFSGDAELWKPGDPVSEYTALYNRFADSFNLAMYRDDKMMLDLIKGEYYKDRKFCYLLKENGKTVAYLIFQDVRNDPAAILTVKDIAWDGKAGFYAILGFLARFTADYGTIRMFLPSCLQLLSVIQTPRAYDIQQTATQSYMVRAMNVKRILEIIKKPDDSPFVIRVEGDAQISENNGTWKVCGNSVEQTEETPNLMVSIQAFGQMAVGAVNLAEAMYRPDVTVSGNEAVLEKVFVRKPILVEDHF
ncbi:GNAT family N-acetyltransferase [Clostridiales bacterium FE2011]|nr:GNAT family N-acetyltransferase [Clostridiales bacterium FE2011]QTE73529.1 GNAT family N-acetyltransferase [Clostridiales bacterium FE2010]